METIEAFADETVFRNDENGYTVLVVKAGKSRVSAVGVMPPVTSGEKLRITGEWTEHPVYGRQIKVQSLEIEQPTTLSGIEKYLSSGMIRGVGPATAKLLIRAFGEQTDYFDHPNTVGFTRSGDAQHPDSGLALLLSNGEDGEKVMSVGVMHANETWHEITGSYDDELTIGDDGKALFKVHGGKLAVWVRKKD